MKDVYPTSTTWPFVLVVLLMLCVVTRPFDSWTGPWGNVIRRMPRNVVKNGSSVFRPWVSMATRRLSSGIKATGIRRDVPVCAKSTKTLGQRKNVESEADLAEVHAAVTQAKPLPEPPIAWSTAPIQPLREVPRPPVNNRHLPRKPERAEPETMEPGTAGPSASAEEFSLSTSEGEGKDAQPNPRSPQEKPRDLHPVGANEPHDNPLGWPRSPHLHALLDQLENDPHLAAWARPIERILEELEGQDVTGDEDQVRLVVQLREYSLLPKTIADLPYPRRQQALRFSYALERRTEIWKPLLVIARSYPQRRQQSRDALRAALGRLQAWLAQGAHQEDWGAYLHLDALRRHLQSAPAANAPVARSAERTLRRIHAADLTPAQRDFLDSPRVGEFEEGLWNVLATAVSPTRVMHSLEAYEDEPSCGQSSVVTDVLWRWQSPRAGTEYRAAAMAIGAHYRNANLRLAVTEDLINRLVPALHQYAERVQDTILGAQVQGSNSTSTSVWVRLVPDRQSMRLRLQARGQVESSTTSRKGPVTMYNRGQSTFSAGKQLIIQPDGIFVTRAQAAARSGTRLVGLRSDLDDIPFLGWIIRAVARQQHEDQRPLLRMEIRRRVLRSARQQMDRVVRERLANVEHRLSHRVLHPLQEMDLDPRAMEMRTTADRLILRSRLASPFQLGGHTPRPRARKDSMLSLQIHETAANNLIEQLELRDRRMTIQELMDSLSQQLGIDGLELSEEHQRVTVRFASQHPMEFNFADDQITLTLHLAELDNGRRTWRNFSVRGCYRADIDQPDIELIRDEGIELISGRFGLRDQLALRSIFTKVLARHHRLRIFSQALAQQPRLQELEVTLLTIRDGWVGLSLGEKQKDARLVAGPRDRPR